jgi:steroid delta-isomerase-like uncharacterized protein
MDNMQIARMTVEDLNGQGKLDLVDQHYDPSYRGHETMHPDVGRDELKKNVQMYRTAFPDLTIKADDVAAAGDKVMVRWTARGTHQGTLFGAAPTGKRAETHGITVYTFRKSKIVEEWTQWDVPKLFRDLGIPLPPQPIGGHPSP